MTTQQTTSGLEQEAGKPLRVGVNVVALNAMYSLSPDVSGLTVETVNTRAGFARSGIAKVIGFNGNPDPSTYISQGIVPTDGASTIRLISIGDINDGGGMHLQVGKKTYYLTR